MKTIPFTLLILLQIAVVPAWATPRPGLAAAIDSSLVEQWGEDNVSWVELSLPDSSLLYSGTSWSIDVPELPRGRAVLYANVYDGGRVLRRIPFRIRVMPFAWTPVLAKPLTRGELITENAIRWEKREVTDVRHRWPDSPDALAATSYRARRSLDAGDILAWPDIEALPEVRQGERVNLSMQRGSVVVETEGIALQDGHAGEIIRVEQQELGSLLRVKVTGTGRGDILNALGR